MTIPSERFRAVIMTERLLKDLLDPKLTPRVPKVIRQRALYCLRHYPTHFELELTAEKAPEWFRADFRL